MTSLEKVRLLIQDKDSVNFTDDDLNAFLAMHNGNELLAAASALDSLIVKLSQAAKSFSIGSYSETKDYSLLAKLADKYREEAEKLNGFIEDYAEVAYTEFNAAEILVNECLRRL